MTTEAPEQTVAEDSTAWHALVPRLLADHGSRAVAEVGVWRGELSDRILRHCPAVRRLILVDPWTVVYGHDPVRDQWLVFGPGTTQADMDESYHIVARQFGPVQERVTILKMPSVAAAEIVPNGSLDAVMIDALHTYHACKEDILAWWPKLKVGGMMIGDDLSAWFPGVQVAVEELFGADYRALGQTWWRLKQEGDDVRIFGSTH